MSMFAIILCHKADDEEMLKNPTIPYFGWNKNKGATSQIAYHIALWLEKKLSN